MGKIHLKEENKNILDVILMLFIVELKDVEYF